MAINAVVRARIDEKTKVRAAAVLATMGLTVSDAFRLLLVKVAAEQKFPFEIHTPNAETVAAMRAADRGQGERFESADALFEHLGI
jgi:DNA-damage-inducible protein J